MAEIDWELTAQQRLEEIQRLNAEIARLRSTQPNESDAADQHLAKHDE